MATLNNEIYSKAISEFEDPSISSAYENNPIDFFKIMYNYHINAMPLFINPSSEIIKLNDRIEPSTQIELFDGNGLTKDFVLTTIPLNGSFFNCLIGSTPVDGTFNYTTNTMTLTIIAPSGTENVSIEWYYPGQFNQTLDNQEKNILACFLVSCWAEKEKNFLLDIRRLLNDTDFSLSAESTTMREKGNWYYSMREKAEKIMMQYAWILHMTAMKTKYGLS